jgi:hypothetical protein
VRVFYTFYFGTRQLTADRQVLNPKDLQGVKIRAIPFPIYMAAVEGMGAVATPVDFAELPTQLATKAVNGQENPVDTIFANKFYETQSHLMLTGHIKGAELVVFNDAAWKKLSPTLQGQMVLRLTIEPDGGVSMCQLQASDMNAPELSTQVVDRVRAINFGAKDVDAITILYPIDFLPAA